jgi:hypothetical protein
MSDPLLPLAVGLAATLPAAALGWTVARIAEPLLRAPLPRSRMWSASLALTAGAGVFAVLWPIPRPAPLPAAPTVIPVESYVVVPTAAPPVWRWDITPWVAGLLAVILAGIAVNLILLGVRLLQARSLVRSARPVDDAALLADLGRHAA